MGGRCNARRKVRRSKYTAPAKLANYTSSPASWRASSAAIGEIDNTATTEDWERAVAVCLRSYALLKDQGLGAANVEELLNAVRRARMTSDRPTTLFRARLGLAAVDLVLAAKSDARFLYSELVDDAKRTEDAFVAREVLAHAKCRAWATPIQVEELVLLVERAGLGTENIPEAVLSELMRSVDSAESTLTETLGTVAGRRG